MYKPACTSQETMIGSLTAFIFMSTLAQSAGDVSMVQPGDNVTFKCSYSDEKVYWYKQSLGHMTQTIAKVSYKKIDVSEQFRDPRFIFTTKDNWHVFSVRNITKEDEAIYYCQMIVDRVDFGLSFINTTFVTVKDVENSQCCVDVRQSPPSASVQPGGSVSLQCSLKSKNNSEVQCPQQHKVHWFRAGSDQSQTGLMYSFTNNSCVYSLSTSIQEPSDTGTYYCAVASCGQVLFGQGTRVEINQGSVQGHDPVTVVLSVLLVCCVVVIIVLCVCLKRGTVCEHCKDSPDSINTVHNDTAGRNQSANVAGGADVNYAALNFSSRKVKRCSKTGREQECVYSSVRADHHDCL